MMDNVRIAILSSHEQVCAFIDNSLPKSLHMYDDELHTYLKGTAATFSFKVSARHPDAAFLVVGAKVSFRHENRDWYFNIVSADQDDDEVDVVGYGASLDLVNSYTTELQINQAYSFKEYVSMADKSKSVTIGINEVASKRVKCEWDSSSTVLARFFSIATHFDAEIELLPRLTEHYALEGITMNAYKEHSDQYQGIGQNRTDVILRNGKNIGTLRRKAEIRDLYTAIWPTGKDGLTLSGIDKEEYDSDGNLEYYSPSGDPRIFAVQAMRRFPSATNRSDYKRYIEYQWSYDTDNVNTLYGQALAQLKKNCVPSVEYETECYVDAAIGDTFVIQDLEFNPPIYLQARVTEQVKSFTDYSRNKTTFDNYKELQSQLDPNLIKQMQEMVKDTVVNPVIKVNADTSLTITDAEGEKTTPSLKGNDAEIIRLHVSSDFLNKSANGTFKTGSIMANARKKIGNNEETEYLGRFKWETTKDNTTWIQEFVSSVDSANGIFEFGTGMIEIESDLLKAIRVSLYKSGGTDVLLDQVTIPVVEDGKNGKDGKNGDPTGITVSETEPTSKYTGMLWKHTGTVSGLIQNATYRWTGSAWELYIFTAENIDVDSIFAKNIIATGTIEGLKAYLKDGLYLKYSSSDQAEHDSPYGKAMYFGLAYDSTALFLGSKDILTLNMASAGNVEADADDFILRTDGGNEISLLGLNSWNTYRESFIGTKTYLFSFGTINGGYLRTNEVSIPWSPDEVNVSLKSINIPGKGTIATDYKYAGLNAHGGLYVYCNTSGADGATDLKWEVAECSIEIAKR